MSSINYAGNSPILPFLMQGAGFKTYAPYRVWSGSCVEPVRFTPLGKKRLIRIYHAARLWNRKEHDGHYGGYLGAAALRVLECLIFDFLNFKSGRLDPSYLAICRNTKLGKATVWRALCRLKELGILFWQRRASHQYDEKGGFYLKQERNAYGICPESLWRGYIMPAAHQEPPAPDGSTWGQTPMLPPVLDQAAALTGGTPDQQIALLEADTGNEFTAQLARTLRAANEKEKRQR